MPVKSDLSCTPSVQKKMGWQAQGAGIGKSIEFFRGLAAVPFNLSTSEMVRKISESETLQLMRLLTLALRA